MKFTNLRSSITQDKDKNIWFITTFETDVSMEIPYNDFMSKLFRSYKDDEEIKDGIYIPELDLYKPDTAESKMNDVYKRIEELAVSTDGIMGVYDITIKTRRQFLKQEY